MRATRELGQVPRLSLTAWEQDLIRVQFCHNTSVGNKVYVSFRFYSQCALNSYHITTTWNWSEKLVTCLQYIKLKVSGLSRVLCRFILPTRWKIGYTFKTNVGIPVRILNESVTPMSAHGTIWSLLLQATFHPQPTVISPSIHLDILELCTC